MKPALALILTFALAAPGVAEPWSRFRGPNGAGVDRNASPPVEWADANFLWRVSLPGEGHGSPVVWEDRVFVMVGNPEDASVSLLCHDARDGEELWSARHEGSPYPMHVSNSFGSSTPAVDERGVYVSWATAESVNIAAYSHKGDRLWLRDLGPYASSHGFGSSPMLAGGLVCFAKDQQAPGEVVGLDRATGDVVWSTPRPAGSAAYSTPCVVSIDGREAIVTQSTASGMTALDAKTGDVLWRAPDAFPERCVSSPALADGLVLGACGVGGGGRQLFAARAADGSEAFRLASDVPYVPTPLVADGMLILWHDRGTVACFDIATREQLWKDRVGGQFFASPVCAGDAIFNVSTEGEVVALALTRERFEVLARNDLGEPTEATPAVTGDRMYLRTSESLMCVGPADEAEL